MGSPLYFLIMAQKNRIFYFDALKAFAIKLWQEVYPQLNNPFHRNPYFRSRDRFMALLLSLRIYPFIKALIRKY